VAVLLIGPISVVTVLLIGPISVVGPTLAGGNVSQKRV
jgi:hypothetical protein